MSGNLGAGLLGSLGDPLFCCLQLGWGEEKRWAAAKGPGTCRGSRRVSDWRTRDKLHLQPLPYRPKLSLLHKAAERHNPESGDLSVSD